MSKLAIIPRSVAEAKELAKTYATSALISSELRGKPADVLVTIMAGQELGLAPMAALRSIHIVEGKPVLSADAMVGIALQSGECEYFRCVKSTNEIASYITKRKGQEPRAMDFTIKEAELASLLNRGPRSNWAKYPAAMLRARCKSALARDVYPDILMGIYDTDEAVDFGTQEVPPPVETEVIIDAEIVENSQADEVEALRNAILTADTEDDLLRIAADCRGYSGDERERLKTAYRERMAVLRGEVAA